MEVKHPLNIFASRIKNLFFQTVKIWISISLFLPWAFPF